MSIKNYEGLNPTVTSEECSGHSSEPCLQHALLVKYEPGTRGYDINGHNWHLYLDAWIDDGPEADDQLEQLMRLASKDGAWIQPVQKIKGGK